MPVLDREALEASPLADLHAIASELSIDGYRRLRRAELIDAILGRQSGEAQDEDAKQPEEASADADADADAEDESGSGRRRRGRRGGRGRSAASQGASRAEAGTAGAEPEQQPESEEAAESKPEEAAESKPERAAEPKREEAAESKREEVAESKPEDEVVEGVVELLPNGSGFVRVNPPEPSDDDVYVSAAQVKRCELVSGDRITGPRRAPRRSERFASLVRIDTINDRPADEVADSTRFDDLPAAFPSERFRLGSEDPTIKAIEWLTPFGRGSRVTIAGPARAGKTEALRRLAAVLAAQEDIKLTLALAGVRPEEIGEWGEGPAAPAVAVSFALSADAQANAVELVVDQARRIAARGADAVVLIDTLDGLHPQAARKALAAARNLVDGGSLTVIATASQPVGGETTVIALDPTLTSTGRFPALDLVASGTLRPELLVGEAAAEAIRTARIEALDS
jgi:transcription termination factor Rho